MEAVPMAVADPQIAPALADWTAVLGAGGVVAGGPGLAAADRSCCGRSGGVLAVLSPSDETALRRCLTIARTHGIAVHPVSLGLNWGYGSRQPPHGPAVVIRLAGLDRIGATDAGTGTVRLQPGVSFGALAAYLREAAPGWLPPVTGAGPDTSVLGNALAGGVGKGPYGWMGRRLSGLSVLLRDGTPARFERVADLPPGAVVTEADFRLVRAPALRTLVWARLADGEGALAEALSRLVPVLTDPVPWMQGELLNGARLALQTGRTAGAGEGTHAGWTLGLTLWGDGEAELEERRRRARALLDGLDVVDRGEMGVVRTAEEPPPGHDGLTSAYALTSRSVPADPDPDRDGCGVRWISPRIPAGRIGDAVTLLSGLGGCAAAHGFPPALTIRFPDGDPVILLGLFWSRMGPPGTVAVDDARAAACAAACLNLIRWSGFALYRHGPGEGHRESLGEGQGAAA